MLGLLGAGMLVGPSTRAAAAPRVVLALPQDVWQDTEKFLKGRAPHAVTEYRSEHARRDVVEVVLAHKALRLGGYDGDVVWARIDAYPRALRETALGTVTMMATSAWDSDISAAQPLLHASSTLIAQGQFEGGLYTHPDNVARIQALLPGNVHRLSAVCHPAWRIDWTTLESVGVGDVLAVHHWESMVRMVALRRADFLLAPFSATVTLELQAFGQLLRPVPGWKVALQGSRAWAISSQHASALQARMAVQKGLAVLTQRRELERAYTECGFMNVQTRNWKVLPPQAQRTAA